MALAKGYWKVTFKNTTGITSDVVKHVYADTRDEAMRKGLALYRDSIESNHGLDWSTAEEVIEKVELIEELS